MKPNYFRLCLSFLFLISTLVEADKGKDYQVSTHTSFAKQLVGRDAGSPSTIYVTTRVTHYTSTCTVTVPHPESSSKSVTPVPNGNAGLSTIHVTTRITHTSTTTKFLNASLELGTVKSKATTTAIFLANTGLSSYANSSIAGNSLSSSILSKTRSMIETTIKISNNNKTNPTTTIPSTSTSSLDNRTRGSGGYMAVKSSFAAGTSSSISHFNSMTTTIHNTSFMMITITISNQALLPMTPVLSTHPSSGVGSVSRTCSVLAGSLCGTSSLKSSVASSKVISKATIMINNNNQSSASASSPWSQAQLGSTQGSKSSVMPQGVANSSLTPSVGKALPATGSNQLGSGPSTESRPITISPVSTVQSDDGFTTFDSIEINTFYSTKTVSTSGPSPTAHGTIPPQSLTTQTLVFGVSTRIGTFTLGGPIITDTRSIGAPQPARVTVSNPITVDHTVTQTASVDTITAGPSTASGSQSINTAIQADSSTASTASTSSSSGDVATDLAGSMGVLLLAFALAALLA